MRALALIVLVGLSGCSMAVDDSGRATYLDERAALLARLDAAIGEARADGPAACRVLPVGEKACGGPAEHRVYSVTDGDPAEAEALATEIAALDREATERLGLVSDCAVVAAPRVVWEGGQCRAGAGR